MNKEFYLAIKARAKTDYLTLSSPIKYASMWNNQVERLRMKEPNQLDFAKPAVFFQWVPGPATYVGNGVLVYENFQLKVHTVHEFFNDADGEVEVNLNVFEVRPAVHKRMQNFIVKGADYGTTPFCLMDTELDDDHDNIYHWTDTYALTWTDNSTSQPEGGYEIDPPLDADITAERLPVYVAPSITVGSGGMSFNTAPGVPVVQTNTVAASHLKKANDALIMTVSNSAFKISLNNSLWKDRIVLTAVNSKVTETTFYVKFESDSEGIIDVDLNLGVPGFNTIIHLVAEAE